MTKEELEKEARTECFMLTVNTIGIDQRDVELAYVMGAEPREKEIKSLGERCLQLQKDKGNLTDSVRDLEERLANADYQLEGRDLEIKELKAQIEKMKQDLDSAREIANRQEQWEIYSVLNNIYNDNFEVITSVSN